MAFVGAPSFEGELPEGGLSLRTDSISRGDWRWPTSAEFAADTGGRASRKADGVEEWFRGTEDGLEQGWTFHVAPEALGPIVVSVSVVGADLISVDHEGIHLNTSAGRVRYGHGAWIDATGERTNVPATWRGRRIELTVPGDLVARSDFPSTLDPIIGPEQTTDPAVVGPDELMPSDAVVECSPTVCMAFWADDRGARAVRLLDNGTVLELPRTVSSDPTAQVGGVGVQGNQFMLTWTTGGAGDQAIDAQYWSDAGGPVGAPIRVAEAANFINSDVACSSDRCLVVWRILTGSLLGMRIDAAGNVLDAFGTSLSATAGNEASVAFDGVNFVVGSSSLIRRVSPAGVNLDPAGISLGFGGGGIVDLATDGTSTLAISREYARLFMTNGTLGPLVTLPTTPGLPNWYRVAWIGSRYLVMHAAGTPGQALDATGALLGSTTVFASSGWGRVGKRPSGGIYLTGGDGNLQIRRLDTTGTPIGTAQFLNLGANPQHSPRLAAGNGQYLLTWADRRLGSWGVYAQRLDADGSTLDPMPLLLMTSAVKPTAVAAAFDGTRYLVARSGADVRGARLPLAGPGLDPTEGLLLDPSSTTTDLDMVWDGTNFGLAQLLGDVARFSRVSSTAIALDSPAISVGGASNARGVAIGFDGITHTVLYDGPGTTRLRRLSPGATFVGVETTLPALFAASPDIACGFGECVISDGSQTVTSTGAVVPTNVPPASPTVHTDVAVVGNEFVAASVDAVTGNTSVTRLAATTSPEALGNWFAIDATSEPETRVTIAGLGGDTFLVAYERYSELDAAARLYVRTVGSADAGSACDGGEDCVSGFCVDGVCCDSACGNGEVGDCLACSVSNGASVDGACGPSALGTVCRSSVDACDASEVCDGVETACPMDLLSAAGAECRPPTAACDAPETCTGSDAACPADAPASAGSVCRPPSGDCDIAELCTGAEFDCPIDEVEVAGTDCRPSMGDCDLADVCDGTSPVCADEVLDGSEVCRPADGDCDAEETCDGASPACPTDEPAEDGTACGDDSVCEQGACTNAPSGSGGDTSSSSSGAGDGGSDGGSCQASTKPGPRTGWLPFLGGLAFLVARRRTRALLRPSMRGVLSLPVVLWLVGCGSESSGSAAGGGSGGEGLSGGSASSGGAAGQGGDGGANGGAGSDGGGGSGPLECEPGEQQPCYQGPPGTEGIGQCVAGTRTCADDGSSFGACQGEVLPNDEACATLADDDCDGQVNEEGVDCACSPGTSQVCYSAAPSTLGVGPCQSGIQTCNESGIGFGECVGEVTPTSEACDTPADDDCDGQVNEASAGCICVANSFSSCYDGPPDTVGVGVCVAGFRQCNPAGTAHGPCAGQVLPTQEDCAQPPDEDCDGTTPSCNGAHVWSRRFGGPSFDFIQGLAVDPLGNVVVVGSFSGTIDMGSTTLVSAGSSDIVVAKFAPDGTQLWALRFGDANTQFPRAVDTDDAGNVVFSGRMDGVVDFGGGPLVSSGADLFVVKLNGMGGHVWSKRFGDALTQEADEVVIDDIGNVLISGWFEGSMNFGGGPLVSAGSSDHYLAKLDASGNHLWSRRYGNASSQFELFAATDDGGNVFLSGSFFGANNAWGGPSLTSTGAGDIFVVKLDPDGNHLWTSGLGGSGEDTGQRVTTDSTGDVIVVGHTQSPVVDFGGGPLAAGANFDTFVVKLDTDGSHVWSRRDGASGALDARGVSTDAADTIHMVGQIHDGTVDFGGGVLSSVGASADLFVLELDSGGSHVWSRRFGGPLIDFASDVRAAPSGDVVVAGTFQATLDLGGGPLSSAGTDDIFVVKLEN